MMTICHDVQSQLSALVDGQLPEQSAQATVRTHLESCAACRGVLQDLEKLRRTAAVLGPMAPPDHVWLEVAGQMHLKPAQPVEVAREVPRRAALAQWLGLAAALLVITTGAYFVARQEAPSTSASTIGGNAPAPGTVEAIAEELSMATEHFDKAIAQLEALSQSGGSTLDASVASTLRQNLKTIDQAISDSRTALAQDPGSEPARDSLFEALRRKVVVLQATVSLMNEMSKGNQAGAAQAAAIAFGKKS